MFSNILGGAAGFPVADLGDEISQSLRFPAGSNAVLNSDSQFQATGGAFTLSFWVKFGKQELNTSNTLSFLGKMIQFQGNCQLVFGYDRRNGGAIFDNNGGTNNSPVFRDPSAWYHFLVTDDGTGNSENTYTVNGSVTWTPGASSRTASNQTFSIGFTSGWGEFDGYFADVQFIDGSVQAATAFGRYQEDGVWVPKNYTGTYGTNGFHLDFADSSDLGNDVSGNNNDFTATGFDTAAISSTNEDNDVDYNDTPTNNYATLNPLNVFDASVTYSKANLRANYGGLGNRVVFVDMPMADGKYYWELTLKDQVEGWAGVITEDYVKRQLTSFADNSDSWAYELSGSTDNQKKHNGSNTSSHGSLVANDTIGFLLDIASGTLKIEINGTTQSNSEFTNIPTSKRLFVAFNIGGGSGNVNMDWNFGQMPFVHSQTGYSDVATNNLPEPTIKNGKEHFDAVLYSGTGSSNAITGLEFSPDFIWIKVRDATDNHVLVDTIRGTDSVLFSNSNDGEASSFDRFTSFDSNGFTVDTTDSSWNNSSNDYVAWCWKAGGTAVSNTDGTITSSVSANTDAGFSIVSYTGNDTNGATVGHGLSSPPEWILFKTRSIGDNWRVYHASVGATKAFQLDNSSGSNGTLAAFQDDFLSNTVPNSTTITLGDTSNVNGTGTQIAYCWHSVEGFSKFGSYEGNNDSDGTFVYLGFKPSLIIFKNADATGSWVMYDTARNTENPVDTRLTANATSSEGTSASMHVDFLSNGFKHRNSDQDLNTSHTFVYMAWAENPFGGENTAPATAR